MLRLCQSLSYKVERHIGPSAIPCVHRPRTVTVACSAEQADDNGEAEPNPALRRPRFKRRSNIVRTPSRQGRLGQGAGPELQQLAALYTQLSPSEKARFDQELDDTELSLLAENLQCYQQARGPISSPDGRDPQLDAYARSLSKYGSQQYWNNTLLEPLLLDTVRSKLSPEDSELLGKLLVPDEATGGVGKGVGLNIGRQLKNLKYPERKRLPGLLARMEQLADQYQAVSTWKGYMDNKLALRRRRRAAQKGLALLPEGDDDEAWLEEGGEEEEGEEMDVDRTRTNASASSSGQPEGWGASLAAKRRRPPVGQSGGTDGGSASAPSTRLEEIATLMTGVAERYVEGEGWKEDGVEGSRDLQRLKALVAKLVRLAKVQVADDVVERIAPQEFMAEFRSAMSELEVLTVIGLESGDDVVRDSVLFMAEHLVTVNDKGERDLQLELATMERWATFVRAAEVRQAYQAFMVGFVDQQRSLSSQAASEVTAMMEGLSQPGRWWLEQQAGRKSEDQDAAAQVDDAKIQALAVLDPLTLRCLADLMSSGFSEAAIMKWSMHPDMGPKLRSDDWFSGMDVVGMPDIVKQAMEEALSGERQVEGVDFDYRRKRSS